MMLWEASEWAYLERPWELVVLIAVNVNTEIWVARRLTGRCKHLLYTLQHLSVKVGEPRHVRSG